MNYDDRDARMKGGDLSVSVAKKTVVCCDCRTFVQPMDGHGCFWAESQR